VWSCLWSCQGIFLILVCNCYKLNTIFLWWVYRGKWIWEAVAWEVVAPFVLVEIVAQFGGCILVPPYMCLCVECVYVVCGAQIETHFTGMFTRPVSAEQCLHNALCVITAMKSAGIEYDIQVRAHWVWRSGVSTLAAFEKSCRLIRLIWSPRLPFVYSIVSIRSIWICIRLLHRDYSEHDLNAWSPDFERSDQCGSN